VLRSVIRARPLGDDRMCEDLHQRVSDGLEQGMYQIRLKDGSLIKIRRMQSAREISWAFTVMCLAATILFVGAKCLLECYNAAMFDSVATLQYTVLLIFKRRYG
jgi:hypothetical protein